MSSPTYPNQSFSKESIISDFCKRVEEKERKLLHPKAAFSNNHSRNSSQKKDFRLPYKSDVNRIIHSKAYFRYSDKTQVVYLVNHDHITHRGLHVQLVSHFSRGLAEILGLNIDLVEAISLGHDVGHPPFGHEGEEYLSELSQEYQEGPFSHPWQSCRIYRDIEPLNLGLFVYDGILCHDGGMSSPIIHPSFDKNWEDHFRELDKKINHPEKNLIPGSLEGSLVKLCDTMSYLGRDIEDAISIGIISRDQVPKTILGSSNQEILDCLAHDLICVSFSNDFIGVSDEVFDSISKLRAFNFENIYSHPKLKVESQRIKRCYGILFEQLIKDYRLNNTKSYLYHKFLSNKPKCYLDATSSTRMVIDFISGMTDKYFLKTFKEIALPGEIEL